MNMRRHLVTIITVFVVCWASHPAIAKEWVFAPRDQSALQGTSDDALLLTIKSITAACDYEIKMLLMTHRLSRQSGFELFASCVGARGVEVLRPEQWRPIADAWNANNPQQKARAVALEIAD